MSVLPVPFEFFTLSVSKKEIISVVFFSLLRTDIQVYVSWYYLNFTFIFYIFKDAYYDSDLYKNSNLTNVLCLFMLLSKPVDCLQKTALTMTVYHALHTPLSFTQFTLVQRVLFF